jgi:hypothetical protein
MMESKTESLTSEEIASMKKDLKNSYLIGVLLGIMLIFLSLLISFALMENILFEYFLIIPLIVIIVTTLFWIGTRNRRLDISNGYKKLTTYQIVEKKSYWDDEPGLGGMKMKYVLYSDIKKFFIEKSIYYQAQIGDYLLEHETPLTRETLKIEIINKPAYNSVYNQLL